MLLSLYASFRWAGKQGYLLKTTVFVILTSLVTTAFSGYFAFLFGPLPLFSFPFYGFWSERRIVVPSPFEFSDRVPAFEARVLTTAAFQLVPQGPVIRDVGGGIGEIDVINFRVLLSKVEVGSIPAQGIYPATVVFLFFLSVNLIGALLGYGISKVRGIREPKWWFLGFVLRIVLGMVFLAAGVWLSAIGEVARTSPVDAYFYSYNPYPFMIDALAFLIFGVVWLIITVGEFTLEHH